MQSTTNIMGPVALIGANGMLARMVLERAPEGLQIYGFDLPEFDMTNREQVDQVLQQIQPRVIINCAAFTAVDACEDQETLATRVNAEGVRNLAEIAHEIDATLVHISTDYVFPGTLNRPYREGDATGPLSAYGRSKLKGEQAITASALTHYFILRTSWLYGPHGPNFVETILRLAGDRDVLKIVADQFGSPTFAGDLADAIFNLLNASVEFGVYHFAGEGECSWYEFAKEIVTQAAVFGIPLRVQEIRPIATDEYPLPAQRPAYSVLDKGKYKQATGRTIPSWRESLAEYFSIRNTLDR